VVTVFYKLLPSSE